MSNPIIDSIEAEHLKTDLPKISIGDTVDVHVRIIEGDKERIQIFAGVVIAMNGRGINQTVTVRRIVANQGVAPLSRSGPFFRAKRHEAPS